MKRTHAWTVLVTVVGLTVLTVGCEDAGAGTGDDNGAGNDSGSGGGGDSAAATLDTGDMLLHLSFDGDLSDETGTVSSVGVLDGSGGQGAAAYGEDRHGGASSAIEFDGSSFVQVTDLDLSSRDSVTVLAWIRDDGSQTQKDRRIAAYDSGPSTVEFAMRIRNLGSETWEDGSFEAWVENSGSNGTRTTENVFPGSWVHVAMVYDAADGELRLYQDGEEKNTAVVSLDIDSGNLNIGGGKSNREFHGRIDDLAVFPRALTAAQIALAKDEIRTDQ